VVDYGCWLAGEGGVVGVDMGGNMGEWACVAGSRGICCVSVKYGRIYGEISRNNEGSGLQY